jgi:hypothetical protein
VKRFIRQDARDRVPTGRKNRTRIALGKIYKKYLTLLLFIIKYSSCLTV